MANQVIKFLLIKKLFGVADKFDHRFLYKIIIITAFIGKAVVFYSISFTLPTAPEVNRTFIPCG